MPSYEHEIDLDTCDACGKALHASAALCPACHAPHHDTRPSVTPRDLAIRFARAGAMPLLNRGDYRGAFASFVADLIPLASDADSDELARGERLLATCDPLCVLSAVRRFIVEYK